MTSNVRYLIGRKAKEFSILILFFAAPFALVFVGFRYGIKNAQLEAAQEQQARIACINAGSSWIEGNCISGDIGTTAE